MKLVYNIVVLSLLLTFFSCKKKNNVSTETPASNTPSVPTNTLTQTTPEYVKFNLNGTSYNFSKQPNSLWATNLPTNINTATTLPNYLNGIKSVYQNNAIVFKLNLVDTIRETTSHPSDVFFRNFIKEANYVFAKSEMQSYNLNVGVWLSFVDNSNVTWKTIKYSGQSFQDTANFKITNTAEYTISGSSNITRKFAANFACKVYNQNGDSAQITNGELILNFEK